MPENNSQGDDQGMKSSGVQSLIDRLQQEGVAAGREQGERIVTDAEKRAAWLIQQAKEEAEQIVSKANAESEFIKQAGQEALQMAVRDSQLFLKNHLMNTFAAQLNSMVSQALSNSDLLEKMILEIACAPEVLCMLWSEDLAWHQAEFQFVEIFSGRANVSREWSPPHWVCFMWAMIC